MDPITAKLILDLGIDLLNRATKAFALAKRGNVTPAELDALVAEDDAARSALQAEIDKRKG
jgi:hypothetical protein